MSVTSPVTSRVTSPVVSRVTDGQRRRSSLPTPPSGQVLLVDDLGNYIIDDEGNYLTGAE